MSQSPFHKPAPFVLIFPAITVWEDFEAYRARKMDELNARMGANELWIGLKQRGKSHLTKLMLIQLIRQQVATGIIDEAEATELLLRKGYAWFLF